MEPDLLAFPADLINLLQASICHSLVFSVMSPCMLTLVVAPTLVFFCLIKLILLPWSCDMLYLLTPPLLPLPSSDSSQRSSNASRPWWSTYACTPQSLTPPPPHRSVCPDGDRRRYSMTSAAISVIAISWLKKYFGVELFVLFKLNCSLMTVEQCLVFCLFQNVENIVVYKALEHYRCFLCPQLK